MTFAADANGVSATLAGSTVKLADHVASILVVDAQSGAPVPLGYGLDTTRDADANGALTRVTVPTKGTKLPAQVRAYLMLDTFAVARGNVAPAP